MREEKRLRGGNKKNKKGSEKSKAWRKDERKEGKIKRRQSGGGRKGV